MPARSIAITASKTTIKRKLEPGVSGSAWIAQFLFDQPAGIDFLYHGEIMIKRGNLIFAVMICGALPLLAAIVASYWLVAGTTARIESDARQAVIKQTQMQLSEISEARQIILEKHLREIEGGIASFANDEKVVALFENFDTETSALEVNEEMQATFQQYDLANAYLCDVQDGSVLYSWQTATHEIPQASREQLQKLHYQYLIRTEDNPTTIGLPFSGSEVNQTGLTTLIAAPITTRGTTSALAVFEVSLHRINTVVSRDGQQLQCTVLANNADAIAESIKSNELSLITPVAARDWNLSLVAKANRDQALSGVNAATRKGASITAILSGGSQAATLWTVFVVVAVGTLIASHIRQPLEKSSKVLQQISLEGNGLLLDNSTNQNRAALLDWIATVVRRVDNMATTFTGEVAENLEFSAYTQLKQQQTHVKADDELREIIRRSQKSLASAVEAARLAEQAISRLGAEISPEQITSLHDVVSDINEQSQWLYENSTWMEEATPSTVGA